MRLYKMSVYNHDRILIEKNHQQQHQQQKENNSAYFNI